MGWTVFKVIVFLYLHAPVILTVLAIIDAVLIAWVIYDRKRAKEDKDEER